MQKLYRQIFEITIFGLIILGLFFQIKSIFEGDKGAIKQIIYSSKAAIEKEDVLKSILFISADYSDDYGNDRRTILALAKDLSDAYSKLSIYIKDMDIELNGLNAEVEIEAVCIAKNDEDQKINVFEGETIKFIVYFQKEQVGWKIIRMELLDTGEVSTSGVS